MSQSENPAWHLDRKVPIALIITIAIQSGMAIWWASSIESRMNSVSQSDLSQTARIGQVENSVQTQAVSAATLAAQLQAVKETLDDVRASQRETNNLLRQMVQGAEK